MQKHGPRSLPSSGPFCLDSRMLLETQTVSRISFLKISHLVHIGTGILKSELVIRVSVVVLSGFNPYFSFVFFVWLEP